MDIIKPSDLLDEVTCMIDYLSTRDEDFYVALELAHQLRDELLEAIPDDE